MLDDQALEKGRSPRSADHYGLIVIRGLLFRVAKERFSIVSNVQY